MLIYICFFFVMLVWTLNLLLYILLQIPVSRIRIRMDPYHLAGSGSILNETDPDPGRAKNWRKPHEKKKKILKNTITKRKNFFYEFKHLLLFNFIAQKYLVFLYKWSLYEKTLQKFNTENIVVTSDPYP